MKVNDWVEKTEGGYRIEGALVALYQTEDWDRGGAGSWRCVVQIWPQGFQHIYRPDQLRVIKRPTLKRLPL
jgi:hypothetical protein